MTTVSKILQTKPHNGVYVISPDAPIMDAAKLMADKKIGALVVTEGTKIIGIVTERDFTWKPSQMGPEFAVKQVRDVMSQSVLFVPPTHNSDECMAIITKNHIRHLPVLENDSLVGLISIGDLVNNVISSQSFTIEHLEQYIMSTPADFQLQDQRHHPHV